MAAGGEADDMALNLQLRNQLSPSRISESELKWAMFCSAVRSYRKESLVKPFPPAFKGSSEDIKDFETLGRVIYSLPSLRNVKVEELDNKVKGLLYWVLRKKDFEMRLVNDTKDVFEKLKVLAGDSTSPPCPSYLFKVIYTEQSEGRFQSIRGDRPVIHGYHGSQLPNFYSILHHGLISNLNKTSAFGEGTYLSNELNVSLNWSPLSVPGAEVSLGKRLSCVVFCQVIQDPTGVKHGTNSPTVSAASRKDLVPEKYVIVQNDALVRVKYVMVYAEKHTSPPKMVMGRRVAHWLREQRYWIVLLGYFLLLMLIGVANSKDLHSYIRRVSHYWLTDYHHPAYDET